MSRASFHREEPLVAAIQRFVGKQKQTPAAWLVAVSGGPDSVALLHALVLLSEENGWNVQAGHVNHQLRGSESDADESFVRELCASLSVPCRTIQIPVRETSHVEGENLEATARKLRYDWLLHQARECGCDWIATGHHADDQAETVLHHLLRGTGLRGLRGIAAKRPLSPEVTLARPLLTVDRQQILAHLQRHRLTYRQDHTNADTDLMRNRIRHELLPWLCERFHAEVPAHVVQLAEQAQEWQEFLTAQATSLLQQAGKPCVGSLLILDQAVLSAAPILLVREAFHLLWEREGWPRGEMTAAHWQRMTDVVMGNHAACELPGGLQVRRQGRVVQVGPKDVT